MAKKNSTPIADTEKNMIGKRFGCWVVTGPAPRSASYQARLMCQCDCGTVKAVGSYTLRAGQSRSCGCAVGKHISESRTAHGMCEAPEYGVRNAMIQRCTNPNNEKYYLYGARGIKVCDRWLESFENFIDDMGKRPSAHHSIDRISPEGDYEPDNCRWATPRQQANNKRSNRLITFQGETRTMVQWARHLGINYYTISSRLNLYGWSVEKAFTEPVQVQGKPPGN